MTQFNTLKVKLSNSQFNKLKSGIKSGTEVTLIFSSNLIGSSNDEATQVSRICKDFSNGQSVNIKFLKTQLSKMIEVGGFPYRLPGPLLKTDLSLIGNVFQPLAKSLLVLFGLAAGGSFTNRCSYSKENFRIRSNNISCFK